MSYNETFAYRIALLFPYRNASTGYINPVLFLAITILIIIPLRKLFLLFNWTSSGSVISLIICLMMTAIMQLDFFRPVNMSDWDHSIHKMTWLFPVIIFRNSFMIEVYLLKKALVEVLVLALIGSILNAVLLGVIYGPAMDLEWSMPKCFLFGTILACGEGCNATSKSNDLERNKKLLLIMETEALISLMVFMTGFHTTLRYYEGNLKVEVDIFIFVARYVLLAAIVGFVIGKISAWLIVCVYNDCMAALALAVSVVYVSYGICEYYFLVSGPIVTFFISFFMALEKRRLTREVVSYLNQISYTALYVTKLALFITLCGHMIYSTFRDFTMFDILQIPYTYAVAVCMRLLSILVLYPLIYRVGGGTDLKGCLFIAWAGFTKGTTTLILTRVALQMLGHRSFGRAMPQIMGTTVLSILLNNSTFLCFLRRLGFSRLSSMRVTNMLNCLEYLNTQRANYMEVLQLDQMMMDTNYSVVYKYTRLLNPYTARRIIKTKVLEEEHEEHVTRQTATCPTCKKEIAFQPTKKELNEINTEARVKVLRMMKTIFVRKYEIGLLSKDGLSFLIFATDAASMSDDTDFLIKLDDYYKIFERKGFFYCMRHITMGYYRPIVIRMPRGRNARVCYRIVRSGWMELFIDAACVVFLLPMIFVLMDKRYGEFLLTVNVVFALIFTGDVLVKYVAYSGEGWRSTWSVYLSSHWNRLDLAVTALHLALLPLQLILINERFSRSSSNMSVIAVLEMMKLARMVKLLRYVTSPMKNFCDKFISRRIAFGYDVGKTILNACCEMIDQVEQVTDSKVAVQTIQSHLIRDRADISKMIAKVVKSRPDIPVEVKTTEAVCSTLNHLTQALNELKSLGHIDNYEFNKIELKIFERRKQLKSLTKFPQGSARTKFMDLPWINVEDSAAEFMFQNAEIVKWDINAVVIEENDPPCGVYVLLSGLLKVIYSPHQITVDNLSGYGVLPVSEFLNPFHAHQWSEEYIFPGNSFGELSVLTQRNYNARIIADTTSKAIFLRNEIMLEAINMSLDPLGGLEACMWKYCSMILTTAILNDTPGYSSNSDEQTRAILERSFIPNICAYRTFVITDLMEDIVLVEGVVGDFNTGEIYAAPCYLPRMVQKILLEENASFGLRIKTPPKLLIIPMKDVDDYEIMERAEDLAELINNAPAKCLLPRAKSRRKKKKAAGLLGMTKRRNVGGESYREFARSRSRQVGGRKAGYSGSMDSVGSSMVSSISASQSTIMDISETASVRYSVQTQDSIKQDEWVRPPEELHVTIDRGHYKGQYVPVQDRLGVEYNFRQRKHIRAHAASGFRLAGDDDRHMMEDRSAEDHHLAELQAERVRQELEMHERDGDINLDNLPVNVRLQIEKFFANKEQAKSIKHGKVVLRQYLTVRQIGALRDRNKQLYKLILITKKKMREIREHYERAAAQAEAEKDVGKPKRKVRVLQDLVQEIVDPGAMYTETLEKVGTSIHRLTGVNVHDESMGVAPFMSRVEVANSSNKALQADDYEKLSRTQKVMMSSISIRSSNDYEQPSNLELNDQPGTSSGARERRTDVKRKLNQKQSRWVLKSDQERPSTSYEGLQIFDKDQEEDLKKLDKIDNRNKHTFDSVLRITDLQKKQPED